MDFGDAAVVAGDEAVEDFRQIHPRAPVQAAHDAEIDQHQLADGGEEDVALMQVGVEEAAADGLRQEPAHEAAGQRLQVCPGGDDGGAVRQFHALHPFEREGAAGGVIPDDGGHADFRRAAHGLGEFRRVAGFAAEVEFGHRPLAEGFDHHTGLQPLELAAQLLQLFGGPGVALEIAFELLFDAGAQHLQGDGAPVRRDGLVDLRDGGGAGRHFGDALEVRAPAARQRGVEFGLHRVPRCGGQIVLQLQKVCRGGLAHEVWPGGERLPQLHRGRAAIFQATRIIRREGRAGAEAEQLCHEAGGCGHIGQGFEGAQHAMARQPARVFRQPPAVRQPIHVGAQYFQPLWMATAPPRIGLAFTCRKPASSIMRAKLGMLGKRLIDSAR